jgi:hypothetical protein
MKKHILVVSMTVLFVTAACSIFSGLGFRTITGSGTIVTETREVSNFNRVDVCCGMELYLTQNDREGLEIQADDNILDEIETRMVSGGLDIYYRDTNNIGYRPSQTVRLYLSVVDIQAVSISGGGRLETDSITTNRFELELSGGSTADIGELDIDQIRVRISGGGELRADLIEADDVDIELSGGSRTRVEDLSAETFRLDSSGGGLAEIVGAVRESEVDMSGGGDFKAEDLETEITIISCSGGGDFVVWVEVRLDADLSGGCSARYYGQPGNVNQDLSGGSQIESLGAR